MDKIQIKPSSQMISFMFKQELARKTMLFYLPKKRRRQITWNWREILNVIR